MSPGRIAAEPAIRIARTGDIARLLQLQQAFETDRLTRRAFTRGLRSPSQLILVAEQAGEVWGSAVAFLRRGSRAARLYDLVVAEQARGTGIGTALVRAVERRSRAAGAASLHLEVRVDNVAAQGFYRRNGYTMFGRYDVYYEDGGAALRMRKLLMDSRWTSILRSSQPLPNARAG
jgi:[ribosomal protein S18]-alanine N-acetyltransferase